MKNKKHALILMLCLIAPFIWLSSCKKEDKCDGMGTLKLSNNSLNTVQRLMVDGVNHGTIDPGESKEISLAPGEHDFQFVGISGGTGCSTAKVIIVECKTSGFACNN